MLRGPHRCSPDTDGAKRAPEHGWIMNPWNEDRLREDSDPGGDEDGRPQAAIPGRRRSYANAPSVSSRDFPVLEMPPPQALAAAGEGGGGHALTPTSQASSGRGRFARRRSSAALHGRYDESQIYDEELVWSEYITSSRSS